MFAGSTTEPAYQRVAAHESGDDLGGHHEGGERYQSEISSSLPAQVLMYFNVMFSIVYFIIEGSLVIMKVSGGHTCCCQIMVVYL